MLSISVSRQARSRFIRRQPSGSMATRKERCVKVGSGLVWGAVVAGEDEDDEQQRVSENQNQDYLEQSVLKTFVTSVFKKPSVSTVFGNKTENGRCPNGLESPVTLDSGSGIHPPGSAWLGLEVWTQHMSKTLTERHIEGDLYLEIYWTDIGFDAFDLRFVTNNDPLIK
jgi:hypothetical protein